MGEKVRDLSRVLTEKGKGKAWKKKILSLVRTGKSKGM